MKPSPNGDSILSVGCRGWAKELTFAQSQPSWRLAAVALIFVTAGRTQVRLL